LDWERCIRFQRSAGTIPHSETLLEGACNLFSDRLSTDKYTCLKARRDGIA
jgi:hypothetical protein